MDDSSVPTDDLFQRVADRLTGHPKRLFQAEVALTLCGGNARRAERRFGWGWDAVRTGLGELASGIRCTERFAARGRARTQDAAPDLAADIRDAVAPRTHADPELKADRRYTDLAAREALARLRDEKGARGRRPAERADHAGHAPPHGVSAGPGPQGPATHDDRRHGRHFRQRGRRPGGGRGRPDRGRDCDGYEGHSGRGGIRPRGINPDGG